MKKLLLVLFLIPLINLAQSRRQTYIDTYKDIAIREMKIYNIPASITLAQGILESGDGQSRIRHQSQQPFRY
jgi:flagellum-specific peptidoglycan hydrolase FlgJ